MKKTDTIAFYRDAYLRGKSEEEIRMFDEKGVDRQYGSIMAWKRRARLAAEARGKNEAKGKRENKANGETASVSSVVYLLEKAKKDIRSLKILDQDDRNRLYGAVRGVTDEVDNFDRYKKEALIRELEDKRNEISREEEDLLRQIEELRQQLG